MVYDLTKNSEHGIHPSVHIESSSIIDKGARIGAGTRLWHWVHICC